MTTHLDYLRECELTARRAMQQLSRDHDELVDDYDDLPPDEMHRWCEIVALAWQAQAALDAGLGNADGTALAQRMAYGWWIEARRQLEP